eukprot:RCo052288
MQSSCSAGDLETPREEGDDGEPDSARDVAAALHDVLDSEVFLDLPRLRDVCRNGIPARVRPTVWKYLLRVSIPDKSQEETHVKRQTELYALLSRATGPDVRLEPLMQQLRTCYPELYGSPPVRGKVERVLRLYLSTGKMEHGFFLTALPHLLHPFTLVEREEDMYYCFCAFVTLNGSLLTVAGLRRTMGTFLMLMAHVLQDLHAHLDDEGVEPNQWLMEWLAFLLSKQLPLECVLRLWDFYIVGGTEEWVPLHAYVCLALLQQHCEKLLDMDGGEIVRYLQKLPTCNVDMVIRSAYNIREEVRSRDRKSVV